MQKQQQKYRSDSDSPPGRDTCRDTFGDCSRDTFGDSSRNIRSHHYIRPDAVAGNRAVHCTGPDANTAAPNSDTHSKADDRTDAHA